MLSGPHGRDVSVVLQKKWALRNMAGKCTRTRVTKEMSFGPHGRMALLVLQKKFHFFSKWHKLFCPSCETNVIFATWQICYIAVSKVAVHSAHYTYVAHM